ncbi:MAG: glycoside hydrolase family 2 TIM barrel-domain containing protein, partial [Cyclobacteriaceae bacterium]
YIQGAGLEFSSIHELAAHGANSFRTWRVDNGKQSGKEVLDEAHRYGLKVMMGIEVARERHGFDYDDVQAVADQLQQIRQDVEALKDHPALIIWGIGNELNLHSTNPKVWNAVNDISKMIHEVDPNHLTTTSLAGLDKSLVAEINERAPDIDILSVQLYGAVTTLPALMKVVGWEGALIVSEWGATGYWEVNKTAWGAPIEENSAVKADSFLARYTSAIAPLKEQCIGSYVFLWGQKQERTSTWFGFFTQDGRKTEVLDVMHYLWNGQWPDHRSPRISQMLLFGKEATDNVVLKAERSYEAVVKVTPTENLTYRWEVLRESEATQSGGDLEEVPEEIPALIVSEQQNKILMNAPKEPGAYRLYVYVEDQADYTAHANIPFFVEE